MKPSEAELRAGRKNAGIKDSAIVARGRMERAGKKGGGREPVDVSQQSQARPIAGGEEDDGKLIIMEFLYNHRELEGLLTLQGL